MRAFILALLLSSSLFSKPLSLRDRIAQAKAGDFVVTAQENNYSLLLLRSVSATQATLEEITVPETQFKEALPDWKLWISRFAPGNTSWVRYEVDLATCKLLKVYSFTLRQNLASTDEAILLPKLLALPLSPLPSSERRRIGPKPPAGETDHRSLWNPPVTIDSKPTSSPKLDVLGATWPKDDSRLSGIPIELYFDTARPSFPFPYWMELKSPHYNFKVRAIDSGSNLLSPQKPPL